MNIKEESKKIARKILEELNSEGWEIKEMERTWVFEKTGFPVMVQLHMGTREVFLDGKRLLFPYFLECDIRRKLYRLIENKLKMREVKKQEDIISKLKSLLNIN
jgi:hypothetical protein